MYVHDPISDFFITIKNAYKARKERVTIPYSRMRFTIAKVLEEAGFVGEVDKKKKKVRTSQHTFLDIRLKYEAKEPAMHSVKLVSTPSRRIYIKARELRPVRSGFGISILSTPKGIMTGSQARKENVGGQMVAEVW